MVSVPNRVWTKRGPLNPAEWERVRLHTYHSQRILSLAGPLRASASVAGLHHERLNGSGYHRGLPANAMPLTARVLAVAEISQATVHTHVINLYGKIGVNTRAGATLYAFEHDLIDSPSH